MPLQGLGREVFFEEKRTPLLERWMVMKVSDVAKAMGLEQKAQCLQAPQPTLFLHC